jgi:ribosome biogenesis GTPase
VLEAIGYDATMTRWESEDSVVGRVARLDRGIALVVTEEGTLRVSLGGDVLAGVAADPGAGPCTGDWVLVRRWPDGRCTLEVVLPRATEVRRATASRRSEEQVLCANVDHVAVVVSLQPEPSVTRLERLLVLAWGSGARPVVVLTKADLVSDAVEITEDVERLAPGVPVLTTSTVTGEGIGELRALAGANRTVALVGTSGHGKSSLANALVGAAVLRTREIRDDGRGRHTTVRRELLPLPGGGAVIDTPGLRGLGVVGPESGVDAAFRDVAALAAGCRFRDCAHQGEPGCAVAAAIDDGRLSLRRFESWQQLERELAWRDARARARQRRRSPKSRRGPRP